ncbi:MAG: site-specific DNA-methyltransferase [Gemmatales bacterium]|nr:site-specific DNA-methyltransferase [Gemmatales bacterium]MDW7994635.1 site-specific DNA-methyltransferase [Gemmatales bacterium]
MVEEFNLFLAHLPSAWRIVHQGGRPYHQGWTNLLVQGDNLQVLAQFLQWQIVRGQVRLVYLDPPFATNQDFLCDNQRAATVSRPQRGLLAYSDKFDRDSYLNFLRQRLVLLHELLADDGAIYVHTDCKIGHYVKILMDEIFGYDNFINDITRIKCNPKNFARRAFGNIKDTILFYTKSRNYIWNDSREPMSQEQIERLFPKVDPWGRRYTTTPLHAPGETLEGPTGQPWRGRLPPPGRHWRYPPEELDRLDQAGLIEWSSSGNPRKIVYADEVLSRGKKRQDVWVFKDPPYPRYPTEKNLDLLKTIILTSTHPGDLVLDCFAGSGTTLVAAELLGRRWIGVDNSPLAIQVACRRLAELSHLTHFTLIETAGS